jgi:thiosulfate dehydrogenase [quinone] large subunit
MSTAQSTLTARPEVIPAGTATRTVADVTFAVVRILIGFTLLWSFIEKAFISVGSNADGTLPSWIDGGSPTAGFLGFATTGPFAPMYQAMAGQTWVDWGFMLALLLGGVALMLGLAMRIAGYGTALLYLLMWTAVLPPEHNPIIDDHVIIAATLVGLVLVGAGDTLGLGSWWRARTPRWLH